MMHGQKNIKWFDCCFGVDSRYLGALLVLYFVCKWHNINWKDIHSGHSLRVCSAGDTGTGSIQHLIC